MPKYTIPAPLDNQPDHTIEVDGVEGLDISAPMKSVNGVYQNLTAQEITDREAEEAAAAAERADYETNHKYKDDRKNAYPNIGDQLDAIWKQLIQDRLNGHAMIQQVDDLIGQINAVKAAHPKPE